MIFRKKKVIKDEKYFLDMLRGLSSYEMICFMKAMSTYAQDMMDIGRDIGNHIVIKGKDKDKKDEGYG